MADAKGVDGIVDMLEAIKVIVSFGKKVSADGKVDITDLPALIDLISQSDKIVKAAKEASDISAEVKDLTMEEAQIILAKLLEVVAAAKA